MMHILHRTFGIGVAFLSVACATIFAEETTTDWSLFTESYGVLSNERLMFPVDVSDWPLKINSKRQLFVDDYLVASRSGLTREVHQPKKHPDNPLITPDKSWEGVEIIVLQVRRDPETGLFRMWYTSRLRCFEPGGVSVQRPALYAESDDGIHRQNPWLGNTSRGHDFHSHFHERHVDPYFQTAFTVIR